MSPENLVLCIGEKGDLLDLRKLVIETAGATVCLAHDLHSACDAAITHRFCAAVIGREFGSEEQASIRRALLAVQNGLAILSLEGFTAPRTLVTFVAGHVSVPLVRAMSRSAGDNVFGITS